MPPIADPEYDPDDKMVESGEGWTVTWVFGEAEQPPLTDEEKTAVALAPRDETTPPVS